MEELLNKHSRIKHLAEDIRVNGYMHIKSKTVVDDLKRYDDELSIEYLKDEECYIASHSKG